MKYTVALAIVAIIAALGIVAANFTTPVFAAEDNRGQCQKKLGHDAHDLCHSLPPQDTLGSGPPV